MRKQYIIITLLSLLFVWNSCKKDEQPIPAASSVAAFKIVASSQYAPAIITVENNSINAKSYHWDFGNGVTSNEQNPGPVKIDEPGLYNVTLEIEPIDDLYYNELRKSIPVNLVDPNADKVKTFYYASRTTGKVHYVRLDGEEPVIYDFPTGGLYKPYGMAIDYEGEKIYVSDSDGFIYRYDLNGENQEVILSEDAVPMLSAPYGLVIIEGKIYWAKEGGIGRANLDGSNPEEFAVFDGAPELPLGMAYDSVQGKIYFVNDMYDFSGGVWTINLDGSGLTEVISGVDAGAIALDTENGKMYYADWVGGVFMADLDGSNIANINSYFNNKFCWGIAVDPDGGHVYVPDRYDDGIIVRTGLDGSNPENWITGVNAYSMAIDIYR
jgi:DNA-binding beta-propeller fold protein YncE